MLRVLQVIDSLHWGGVQQLQVTLAEAARGSDLSLALASLGPDEATPYRARLESLGVCVQIFPSRKLLDLKRILALAGWIRSQKFDLVNTHLMYSNIVGGFAARLTGVPAVATLHLPNRIDPNPLRERLNDWVLRYLMRDLTAVGAAVAEAYAASLHHKPVRVIPNAVPVGPDLPYDERLRIRCAASGSASGPVLISTGRLDEVKGYGDLLKAAALLLSAHPSLQLLIAGEGVLFNSLQEQIRVLGLAGHAHLLGGRTDVPDLLAASDIYVSASYLEGMSISILEALAAGLPVVATHAGENARFITPDIGILSPPGDPAALAAGIAGLLDSPKRCAAMGASGRARIRAQYNVGDWFRRIREVYFHAAGRQS